jgi:hypothetical protein
MIKEGGKIIRKYDNTNAIRKFVSIVLGKFNLGIINYQNE